MILQQVKSRYEELIQRLENNVLYLQEFQNFIIINGLTIINELDKYINSQMELVELVKKELQTFEDSEEFKKEKEEYFF